MRKIILPSILLALVSCGGQGNSESESKDIEKVKKKFDKFKAGYDSYRKRADDLMLYYLSDGASGKHILLSEFFDLKDDLKALSYKVSGTTYKDSIKIYEDSLDYFDNSLEIAKKQYSERLEEFNESN